MAGLLCDSALRGLSPGLKKYTFDDALGYLLESERLMPSPPHQYCVTNRSMIGPRRRPGPGIPTHTP